MRGRAIARIRSVALVTSVAWIAASVGCRRATRRAEVLASAAPERVDAGRPPRRSFELQLPPDREPVQLWSSSGELHWSVRHASPDSLTEEEWSLRLDDGEPTSRGACGAGGCNWRGGDLRYEPASILSERYTVQAPVDGGWVDLFSHEWPWVRVGNRLFYQSWHSKEPHGIYRIDLDTIKRQRLAPSAFASSFDANERFIVWVEEDTRGGFPLRSVRTDGSDARTIEPFGPGPAVQHRLVGDLLYWQSEDSRHWVRMSLAKPSLPEPLGDLPSSARIVAVDETEIRWLDGDGVHVSSATSGQRIEDVELAPRPLEGSGHVVIDA
jgi:hypothetical protein